LWVGFRELTTVDELQRRSRLEALFNEHAGAVRGYARRRIDADAADDTVSEVFAVACRRLQDVPDDALPWLLGCARNVIAHQHRRAQRDVALAGRLQEAVDRPAVTTIRADGDDALRRALTELSEHDLELLMLIAWEGLRPAQAAQVLGCSRNTLAVRLHRARRRLAAALRRADGTHRTAGTPRAAKETL